MLEAIPDLAQLATKIMRERGLDPDFSSEELEQLSHITKPASCTTDCDDLRSLLWCSIDNDDSQDLDQLTYAEKTPTNKKIVWVAVADVAALVPKDSPIDLHARLNTTSVYTPKKIFPMLPEKLSTNLTSLNENEDRIAMVVKMEIDDKGNIENSSISQARVHNYAKLTYSGVGAWLEGKNSIPQKIEQVTGLENALKIQHEVAQLLKKKRHAAGSLTLESSEGQVKVEGNNEIVIQSSTHNFAHQLIEEFMIASNMCVANFFKKVRIPNLRRVVRIPKYWNRIVEVAQTYGEKLPSEPDSKALDAFLIKRKAADPDAFPDISLTIIKLLGKGEYVVENGDARETGHFALALSDYTHSTAPNRRYPDLISQRQYKAYLAKEKSPYGLEELRQLAAHCSAQEDAAVKVERQVSKSAAAILLSSEIGKFFDGIITGINEKGTWVRLFKPVVEGRIVRGIPNHLQIGDRVTVQLESVNIQKGFIDFILKN